MANVWRAVRRRLLTPDVSDTQLDKRGFHAKNDDAKELLETVGRSFVKGFGHAAYAGRPAEVEQLLEAMPRDYRGFAYEGAAMGLTIMDAMSLGSGGRIKAFLAGRGGRHIYMAHIGIGWAMARLPRMFWRRVMPTDPLLHWLALEGYGFHQAYFRTDRYVHGQYQRKDFPWPLGHPHAYADQAIDQGIGRALWFVEGTDVGRIVDRIAAFPKHRHGDLFSGTGLAATYAGGVGEAELATFWDRAGDHRPVVAQACAFAAKARVLAGLVTPHTHLASSVFCGMSPEEAAAVTDRALVDLPPDGERPSFEVWRQRIAEEFVSVGRY
ncbi:DUF1702 family protein [Micromonospora sp. SL1-18]|uniref:DUF1702 family protein n=1 Tax=Micromonospora sp. SL1-18 TaxID=3399128 RepID=UPI003A4DDBDF